MKLTPEQRRERIYEIAEADGDYRALKAEYGPGKALFEKTVDRMPKKLRDKLWVYPGTGYFLHHRMLNLICQHMKFKDED